ncbi:MAG: C4-dicarboxylate transporter DcuC, partial [Gemmataceae bacterium]
MMWEQWAALGIIAGVIGLVARGTDVRLVLFAAAGLLGALAGQPTLVLRVALDTFSAEKFVIPICTAMGFAYVLRHTGCDGHLVRMLTAPLQSLRPVLIPGVLLVAFVINIPIISQSSTLICVGPVVIPLLRAAGYRAAVIAATLVLGCSMGGELLNPGAPELLTVSAKTHLDTKVLAWDYLARPLAVYAIVAGLVFWIQSS